MKILPCFLGVPALALGSGVGASASGPVEKPNIMIILVDDLGYGDLSCQGAGDISTPHIDRLLGRSVKLTNFYANSTVCSPTRASLLTGCYPDKVGVPGVIRPYESGSFGFLSPEAVLLPELLSENGYSTNLIGKWHLGPQSPNLPNERGFGEFKGFIGGMLNDYWEHTRFGQNMMRHNADTINPEGHATDLFASWTLERLETLKKDEQPFFLYLAFNAPHDPIQPPPEWVEKVKEREVVISDERAAIVALIEHLDYNIGRVLDYMDQEGLMENTILFFASDNGGALRFHASNGELRGGKQDLYEGGIKVPACIYYKGVLELSECDKLMLTMDIMPTLCEITGITPPEGMDGIPVYSAMRGEDQNTSDRFLFWMRREGGFYNGLCYYAARKGNLKLVQNTPFTGFEYFDLETDPYETRPLFEPESPELKQLRNQLQKHIKEAGRIPWQ